MALYLSSRIWLLRPTILSQSCGKHFRHPCQWQPRYGKYSLRCMAVPVHRCTLNQTFATMPAHCVVNVDFPPLGFAIKPPKRFLRSAMFWIENLLKICLRCFHPFTWAIYYCLPFRTRFGMALQVASFCESLIPMNTFIRFCQVFDVFYDEGEPFINTDCQNVCQLGQRASSEMPYNFSIFSPLKLIHPDSEPTLKSSTLIQMSFNLV